MQTQSFPAKKTKSNPSDSQAEISSDEESFTQKVASKFESSKSNQVPPSKVNDVNELSTTNFHYEIDQSWLPESKVQESSQVFSNKLDLKEKISSKSTTLNDSVQDDLELKELLRLLEDAKESQKPHSRKNPEKSKPSQKTRSSNQVKVQNSSQRPKIEKNQDNFKKLRNDFPPANQKFNSQAYEFQANNFQLQNYPPIHQPMQYPSQWNQWQQYQEVRTFQNPYFEIPLKQYQNQYSMTKNQRPEETSLQNFMFWNVWISIRNYSIFNLKKNVLVVPFSSSQLDEKISRVITKKLKYNINQILSVEASKNNRKEVQDGYVFSVKAKGLQKNYRGIYFVKSPRTVWNQEMKYYCAEMLSQSMRSIFNLVHDHMEEEIVFPDFEWGCLSQNELCESLVSAIFREVSEQRRNYRCMNLKEVVICVDNFENFEIFSRWLQIYAKQVR